MTGVWAIQGGTRALVFTRCDECGRVTRVGPAQDLQGCELTQDQTDHVCARCAGVSRLTLSQWRRHLKQQRRAG